MLGEVEMEGNGIGSDWVWAPTDRIERSGRHYALTGQREY